MFPIGIASGGSFCNRVKEREMLAVNIKNGRHTVLLAPRRYGKTSLATEVLRETKSIYTDIDLLLCGNEDAIESRILERVGELIYQILPKTKKLRDNVLSIFKTFKPELTISMQGVEAKVKLFSQQGVLCQQTISDVLIKLDEAAKLAKKRVVVFIDEFQQVGELRDKHVIEASIRHAVERAKNVSYIFSGSNRHLLLQMFSEKSRPFYRLCHVHNVKRIDADEHRAFIQLCAKKKWKKTLLDNIVDEILKLSECHSYYVNVICNYFWTNNIFPTKDKVNDFWQQYVREQHSMIASELSGISNNQKTLMRYFANNPTNQPYASNVLLSLRLTVASARVAMTRLLAQDLLYVDHLGFYQVLDPAVKTYIKMVA